MGIQPAFFFLLFSSDSTWSWLRQVPSLLLTAGMSNKLLFGYLLVNISSSSSESQFLFSFLLIYRSWPTWRHGSSSWALSNPQSVVHRKSWSWWRETSRNSRSSYNRNRYSLLLILGSDHVAMCIIPVHRSSFCTMIVEFGWILITLPRGCHPKGYKSQYASAHLHFTSQHCHAICSWLTGPP